MRNPLQLSSMAAALMTALPAAAEPARRWDVDVAATAWQPRRDARDYAETSAGVRPRVTFAINRVLAVTADVDWVFVDRRADLMAGDVYYYAVSIGGRFTPPWQTRVRPFADVTAGRYALHVDCAPGDCAGALVHDAVLGWRLGAGANAAITPRLTATAGLGYSHASLDVGFLTVDHRDIDALVFDVGVGLRL